MFKKIAPPIMLVVGIVFATLNLFFQILPVSTHEYFKHILQLGFSGYASILSLYMLTYALLQVPAGIILDRYGVKYTVPTALFICLLSFCAFVFAKSIVIVAIARTISGIACAISYISAVFIASKYFDRKYLALTIILTDIIGTLVSVWWDSEYGVLISGHSWLYANSFVIVLIALILILSVVFSKHLDECSTDILPSKEIILEFGNFFKKDVIVAIFIYIFFTWMVMMSFAGFWIQAYLKNVHNYTSAQCSIIFYIYWWSFVLAALVMSWILNKQTRSIYLLSILAFIGFLDFAIMSIPVIFDYWEIVAVVVFAGISASGIFAAFTLGISLVSKRFSGTITATINSFMVLGGYVGQIGFGSVISSQAFAHIFKIFTARHNIHLVNEHFQTAINMYPLATFMAVLAAIYITGKYILVKYKLDI